MSALSGYREDGKDTLISPLIFSTEIARSVKVGEPKSARATVNNEVKEVDDLSDIEITYENTNAGDINPTTKTKKLNRLSLIDGIIYGLVNIRTDGNKILFAIRKEKGTGWETSKIYSRFAAD